jgi:sarcosine oxidase subunit beta
MNETADAVIIGAGIIGAAVAFELTKRGYATLSVDRLPAAGVGPTSNSCSIVRAHYSSYQGVAMAHESFHFWNDWSAYVDGASRPHAKFIDSGTVQFKAEDGHFKKVVKLYDEVGVEYEDWDLEQLKREAPMYDVSAFWPPSRPNDPDFMKKREETLLGALFTPQSGYVNDPQLATENIKEAAERRGARFAFKRHVVRVLEHRGRVGGVQTRDGRVISAPIVVNVAGPHSGVINRLAGVEEDMNIKTRPLRHEVHIVPAPGDFKGRACCHTSDGDQGIYWRPEAGGNILIGSEDPTCDPQVWPEDPDKYARRVTQAQWDAQVYRMARRLPSLRIPTQSKGIVDLYDTSDDWIPIYDKSGLDGFYMAIGTSGNQFKNASMAGILMAELIDRCENGLKHDEQPVELTAPHTALRIDGAFYSRLREINRESSFSVNG